MMARDVRRPGVPLAEIVAVLSLATDLGYGQPMEHVLRSCALALRLSESLGLKESERAVVYYVALLACVGCFADAHEQARWFGDDIQQAYEGWDGKGEPNGLKGGQVGISVRLTRLARTADVFYRRGGTEAAIGVARSRRGSEFDPRLVDAFCERAPDLLEEVATTASWDAIVNAEPALRAMLTEQELDAALEALADYTDLKSPYTIGHSRGVADLATEGGHRYGLPADDVLVLRRAALVHDLGRLGVSNAIWDKPGPLTPAEWERVRLHPYLTGRMLASSPALRPLAAIAAQHHERLDGSGYPSGLSLGALSPASRILAAADVYHAATEPRPHRAARTPGEAASELRSEVRAGTIDDAAADAVLA